MGFLCPDIFQNLSSVPTGEVDEVARYSGDLGAFRVITTVIWDFEGMGIPNFLFFWVHCLLTVVQYRTSWGSNNRTRLVYIDPMFLNSEEHSFSCEGQGRWDMTYDLRRDICSHDKRGKFHALGPARYSRSWFLDRCLGRVHAGSHAGAWC